MSTQIDPVTCEHPGWSAQADGVHPLCLRCGVRYDETKEGAWLRRTSTIGSVEALREPLGRLLSRWRTEATELSRHTDGLSRAKAAVIDRLADELMDALRAAATA